MDSLNKVLYRCDQEERDETGNKFGVYDVPGYGPLVYAGLQGVISVLADIRLNNDLGHPLCDNLRNGDWLIGTFIKIYNSFNFYFNYYLKFLIFKFLFEYYKLFFGFLLDYVWQRLKEDESTKPLGEFIEKCVEPLKLLPRYLIPSYFDALFVNIYTTLIETSFNLMSE